MSLAGSLIWRSLSFNNVLTSSPNPIGTGRRHVMGGPFVISSLT